MQMMQCTENTFEHWLKRTAVFEINGLNLTHAVRYMKDGKFMQRINALMGMSSAGPVKQPYRVAATRS